MKTTVVLIAEKQTQIVLTPENEFEQSVVNKTKDGSVSLSHGSFFACRGGWIREGTDDTSLILSITTK